MRNQLNVSPAPHVRSKKSTALIMLCVIVALLPSCIFGVFNFGLHALLILLVSVGSAVASEALYELIFRKKVTVGDLSAVVTGLLLGMNMPPTIDWWIPAIGSAFAIIVVKQLFGGLGQNFMNPALAARCFLVLVFSMQMTAFRPGAGVIPQTYQPSVLEEEAEADAVSSASSEEGEAAGKSEDPDVVSAATAQTEAKASKKDKKSEEDAVSAATAQTEAKASKKDKKSEEDAVSAATVETEAGADAASSASEETGETTAAVKTDAVSKVTPMAYLKKGQTFDLNALFFGNTLGTIGETSAILLLIGGIFLILMGIIDWKIPVVYMGSFVLLVVATAGARGYEQPLLYAMEQLLAGGIMMGAFFMATDYATVPLTGKGRVLFALALGILTWLYRMFGTYKEGVSNAIILANCLTPLIDRFTMPVAFGIRRKKEGQS